ncbi:carbohydrate ABC transporter permease [uncultured Subdoligranulum sp.]|uniref:carbohydrate ABC transporter permease n=1 Tax=uncultured Subdoligranulum sp. TaxID=512298 RepID=UPI0025FCD987|nr:sugar ABC transporter permease [uncultured Subdoligranulum sp.]
MNAISAAKMRRNLEFATPYTCLAALREGSTETRVSALVMGFGNMMHKQVAKGLLFLAAEIAYIAFMVLSGFHNLAMLGSLGTVERQEVWNEELQVFTYTQGDQSILLLLYGLATIILTGVMFWVWRGTLKSAYKAECLDKAGKHLNTLAEDLKSLLDDNLYRLLMTPPMIFIGALTILPLVFMICMAFTNYSKIDNHLVLFDWVGLQNFATLFDSNSVLGSTFWSVLVWTLVWAFFATFTNYIAGMILAIVINIWVGVPYTLLQLTGVLQNIPTELYEAAKVDGANAFQTFFRITLPYMLYVTTPYLIATFTGNVNNFNVIYLLSGGDPVTNLASTAGSTDLLVTWLYKLTIDKQYYNVGAVVGILTFIILAIGSLLTYRNSKSYREEGGI